LLEDRVIPAYKNLRNFLKKQYLPKAPEVIGISNIKEGKRFYEQRAKYYTTLDITPEEIFKTGQAEVKRIRGEMEAIIKELKFEGRRLCGIFRILED